MGHNGLKNRVRRLRFEHGEMTRQQHAEKVGLTRLTIIAMYGWTDTGEQL